MLEEDGAIDQSVKEGWGRKVSERPMWRSKSGECQPKSKIMRGHKPKSKSHRDWGAIDMLSQPDYQEYIIIYSWDYL